MSSTPTEAERTEWRERAGRLFDLDMPELVLGAVLHTSCGSVTRTEPGSAPPRSCGGCRFDVTRLREWEPLYALDPRPGDRPPWATS